jgi:tRNA-binding protein
MTISWDDFSKIDIRVGTITEVSDFPKAKKPAYRITVDFGELGTRKSSAQVTHLYAKKDLEGMQVAAVINFPPKQISDFSSECLILGVYTSTREVVLLKPERPVVNGWKIG